LPRREDISSVLIIGSGPIVIGQACEFDYSGTQACRVLREEGYRVILVNSNPATIMTDPEFADATYLEPITPAFVEKVMAKERPDALLPTLGGQTALNVAVKLAETGILDRYGCELIGASLEAIRRGEDRREFKATMQAAGLDLPRSGYARTLEEARVIGEEIGFPIVVRPSFTLGGGGSGIAMGAEDLVKVCRRGIEASPISEVLLEECLTGWKEYELEVMRDRKDNAVVVCSIENVDPMGVHTGDSITVAPAITLTDREYQVMRDAALKVIRAIGVETGGSNIQFAVHPKTGRMVVIEMNPRVSRSSALASKATGFPIAKIAAKLAIGYSLDEIPNDITRETLACFEPTIDYIVVKIPRFAFEKFPGANPVLGTSMKSVGEVMAIGRTFKEALQKGLRSLETDRYGLNGDRDETPVAIEELKERIGRPSENRLFDLELAVRAGIAHDEIAEITGIDPWFVDQIGEICEERARIEAAGSPEALSGEGLRRAKQHGFSDHQIAHLTNSDEAGVLAARRAAGVTPVFKTVDTCAAEFEAYTPYYYSTYEEETEVRVGHKPRVVILGSGPNRIGQGIEFDYCCVHASFALREAGYETVMINCNPETVSTDYDTSDRLYFEPLTFEDVLAVCEAENPVGVIVQLGGQTPLKLAHQLEQAGVRILGTSPDAIDRAEDRGRFGKILGELGLYAPQHGTASSLDKARTLASRIGYPVMVRPSYVLGGRAMEIVYDESRLTGYLASAAAVSPNRPILIDRFLEDAIEIDVDALYDGEELFIGGIMEHIEEAGIHSGDSACALPPITLGQDHIERIRHAVGAMAEALEVRGLINIQFALKDDKLFVLEANPRASRTVPFVSKATGVPLAKVAARVMVGEKLADLRAIGMLPEHDAAARPVQTHVAVKEAVMPFSRFPGVDTLLGPEMRSTGEVMGLDESFGIAYAKSQEGAYGALPTKGRVFISVRNQDKRAIVFPAWRLHDMGFEVLATAGTAEVLRRNGIPARALPKVSEGPGSVVDLLRAGEVDLIINTPQGSGPRSDGYEIRTAAVTSGTPSITTLAGAAAAIQGIDALLRGEIKVRSLQEYLAAEKASDRGER